jgi:Haem-NO-binding
MKGIVFNEFVGMVEGLFGDAMMDEIFDETPLVSGGSYTSVGTYNAEELVQLVVTLSKKVNVPVNKLVHQFGLHLASVFSKKFPGFFDECIDSFSFLQRVDQHIHIEVKKLYPDADLPRFYYDKITPNSMQMIYQSKHNFGDLALGLIEGCSKHYNETLLIETQEEPQESGCKIIFTICKQD